MVYAADTKGITMKLAIIQAAIMAALFLIAAAVSYHSGYVGGRIDGESERTTHSASLREQPDGWWICSAIWTTEVAE